MCTVSFISVKDAAIITSNRDEHEQREGAAAPSCEVWNDSKMIFPKDGRAGGTWFAASDKAVVAVLLNGAFVKHIPNPPYRKSRGLVLLDIISSTEPLLFFNEMDLHGIEPFTVILYRAGQLNELRWDGRNKHDRPLSSSGNYIWSSATLYGPGVIERREKFFEQFLNSGSLIDPASVYRFHTNNNQDDENGFLIKRSTGMRTLSITQAVVTNSVLPGQDKIKFLHTDLLQDQSFEEEITIGASLINL